MFSTCVLRLRVIAGCFVVGLLGFVAACCVCILQVYVVVFSKVCCVLLCFQRRVIASCFL